MKEEIIFKQSETVRSITVELLESIPESDWDLFRGAIMSRISISSNYKP